MVRQLHCDPKYMTRLGLSPQGSMEEKSLKVISEAEADPNFSQVFIRVDMKHSWKVVKETFESMRVEIVDFEEVSSNLILVRLNSRDMRGIALRLTESGFIVVRGLNPSSTSKL